MVDGKVERRLKKRDQPPKKFQAKGVRRDMEVERLKYRWRKVKNA